MTTISHSRIAIIGSAPCVFDDLVRLCAMWRSFSVMVVNEGAGVTQADHLFSLHIERIPQFIELQATRFGRRPVVHGAIQDKTLPWLRTEFPFVDEWWRDVQCGGTSAWGGVSVARLMGYDQIALCGCPMQGGDGYFEDTHRGSNADPRFGHNDPDSKLVRKYQERLRGYKRLYGGEGVYSMSGYTAELFGYPEEVAHGAD